MEEDLQATLDVKTDGFDPSDALQELQRVRKSHPHEITQTLQKILGLCQKQVLRMPSEWQPLMIELVIHLASKAYQDEEAILSGRIIFSILTKSVTPEDLANLTSHLLQPSTGDLELFTHKIPLHDPEIFKLTVINSHLSVSKKPLSPATSADFFSIIQPHCSTYTRHTFLAFRLLKLWLESTRSTSFWSQDTSKLEEQLESLIISNWDNCISDMAKWNATEIYSLYLEIMKNKYPRFLEKSWSLALARLSWQNPTKFTILSTISSVMSKPPRMEPAHIEELVRSLPKSHLKHPSTKLYLSVWSKVSEEEWLNMFYRTVHPIVKSWEKENNLNALQLFWDLWLRPMFLRFSPSAFFKLWSYIFTSNEMIVSQSFLARFASERNIRLTSLLESKMVSEGEPIEYCRRIQNVWIRHSGFPHVLNDVRECVRLNAFAIYCRGENFTTKCGAEEVDYEICKKFLYFNARAASTRFRRGLLTSFKTFIERISTRSIRREEIDFSEYLHEFILNCFEVGSCYQRKIIGLSLHSILLEYTKKHDHKLWSWTYTSKRSLHALARLCLDPVEEVRSKACDILCTFDPEILTEDEKDTLHREGLRNCRSWKFYEISGGAKLLKVVSKTTKVDLSQDLLAEAQLQLSMMKEDIGKATTRASPFYGVLTALLETADIREMRLDEKFIHQLVELLEDAANFFLSSLSPKSEDSNFSSSFADMGMAIEAIITNSGIIDDGDECVLSSAHQTILSCIWMSLATICEVSGRLTYINALREEIYIRLIDIVVTILMKCRHKGVIEAAGGVLGGLMNNQNLRVEHFVEHLQKLLSLDSREVNMTRRGAGQTIMFHKLVSNGNKKSRPLLQIALLRILGSLRDSGNPGHPSIICGASVADDPIARQIHFLRSAVADKSLHQHLLPHMEEIAIICLLHLRSSEWPVRNASLQLLGAVIYRLVGQSGDESGHSIEHFVTHYPNLAEQILRELTDAKRDDDSIMPALCILSKMTVSGEDFVDYSSDGYRKQVLVELWRLFGHRVAGVRNLVAKTYAAFVPPRDIAKTIIEMMKRPDCRDRNHQHCHFLAMEYLLARALCESVCNSEEDSERILKATDMGLRRLELMLEEWYRGPMKIDFVVESAFIKCLLTSPKLKTCHFKTHMFRKSAVAGIQGESERPGYWEFLDRLAEIQSSYWALDTGLNQVETGEIERYDICLMEHVIIGETRNLASAGKNIQAILTLLLRKISDVEMYYPQILEFIIKVLEDNSCRKYIDDTRLLDDCKRIVVKLIESDNNNLRKLGHMLIALILFDDCEFRKKTLEFTLWVIRHEDDSEKLWALNCLRRCLERKDFGVLASDLKFILEALVILLNDEIPEIREAANEIFTISGLTQSKGIVRESKHAEINLHEILRLAISVCSLPQGIPCHEKLENLVKNILGDRHSRKNSGSLESPFNYDETYREDGKFLNVISELILSSSIKSSSANEEIDFTRIIKVGRDYQENYITSIQCLFSPYRLPVLLNIRHDDYISYKLYALNEIMKDNKNYTT